MSGIIGDNVYRASGVVASAAGAGGISWQDVVTASTLSATAGEGYPINTTSNACTVTLPAGSAGDIVEFVDYAGTWDTNAVTLTTTEKIKGSDDDKTLKFERQGIRLVYADVTQGWVAVTGVNETNPALTPPPYDAYYLVVGGGGGGSGGKNTINWGNGAGGGGGGYRTNYGGTAYSLTPGTVYSVTVGTGGAAGLEATIGGATGVDSTFTGSDITNVTGSGGGGGAGWNDENAGVGKSGGSGGGGSMPGNVGTVGPGNVGGDGGSPSIPEGFDGGAGFTGGPSYGAGGGGGASEVGADGTGPVPGDGGDGLANAITGPSVTYAGGGGGSAYTTGTGGSGGAGGGGDGGPGGTVTVGGVGTDYLGGGGGAGSQTLAAQDVSGGVGGIGVVFLRMATSDFSGTVTGSPTETTDGTDTILEFRGATGGYTA